MNLPDQNSRGRNLALISGGSRGLGFETAKALRSKGFDLILASQSADNLARAKASLEETGGGTSTTSSGTSTTSSGTSTTDSGKITTYSVDFGNIEESAQALDRIAQSHPEITHLVISHAVMSEKMSKTLKTTDAEWRRVMSINLDSVFQIVNRLVPAMVEARNGRVIIYSACLGRMSGPGNAGGLAPYRISKAGVNALVRNLAHETGLGARGVLVDALCPNHSRTDMGGPDAPRSAEEGAETAVWLATREFEKASDDFQKNATGVLWEDHQIVPW